MPGG
jgi:RHS repeat-associated protein